MEMALLFISSEGMLSSSIMPSAVAKLFALLKE
jgi:hypothetical protein